MILGFTRKSTRPSLPSNPTSIVPLIISPDTLRMITVLGQIDLQHLLPPPLVASPFVIATLVLTDLAISVSPLKATPYLLEAKYQSNRTTLTLFQPHNNASTPLKSRREPHGCDWVFIRSSIISCAGLSADEAWLHEARVIMLNLGISYLSSVSAIFTPLDLELTAVIPSFTFYPSSTLFTFLRP